MTLARRDFMRAALPATGALLIGCAGSARARRPDDDRDHDEAGDAGEAEVTPGEDLMQEHGVLERILLIYDEVARRIDDVRPFDVAVVITAAGIVRNFVEDYHERNEEDFVFPRLEAAGREVELVAVLRRQHARGREVTDDIVRVAGGAAGAELARLLRAFQRMYRPHAAREDTVLFPAFRAVIGRNGYAELGESFEDREHERFGAHGFDDVVTQLAALEQGLGLADLATFTP